MQSKLQKASTAYQRLKADIRRCDLQLAENKLQMTTTSRGDKSIEFLGLELTINDYRLLENAMSALIREYNRMTEEVEHLENKYPELVGSVPYD